MNETFFIRNLYKIVLVLFVGSHSFCSGVNILTVTNVESSTHPVVGDSNFLQILSKGNWIFSKQSTVSGIPQQGEVVLSSSSCARSFLGLVGWGDSSLEEVLRRSNIKKIAFVEYTQEAWLSGLLFHSFCTVVSGETVSEKDSSIPKGDDPR
ncbi:TRL-like family protein [Leptospira inadai serovar Lyme str. 10]|uniref:TRL-like family protein n=2 Tax=Leptospira inadai serovar Lyme TaxID=293084 RepID=V6HM10_9LEPT|nr:TRL domain-containing protein [Leptospira inadai]EQA37920.1 TRL-like family protein [Leptospira inadai serovar Lyme str. 10]PNV75114.1 TRL-like family protein [Leptospira inadai serovar Lyme]